MMAWQSLCGGHLLITICLQWLYHTGDQVEAEQTEALCCSNAGSSAAELPNKDPRV